MIALPVEDDDPAGAFDTSWLDRTASVAWHCFDGTISIDDLVDELEGVFVGERKEIREDLVELARTFGRSGLLHGVRPDPRPAASGAGPAVGGAGRHAGRLRGAHAPERPHHRSRGMLSGAS